MKVFFKFSVGESYKKYYEKQNFFFLVLHEDKYKNTENRFWCWSKDFEEFLKLHEDLLQTKT